MQTTLSYRVGLSVQGQRGGERGTCGSCPAGAPGWPDEEGFPVWKTAAPGALKGESFLHIYCPDVSVMSSGATRSRTALSAWGQPEQEGDRWAQAGLRPQQLLSHCTAKTVSSALCSRGAPHRAGSCAPAKWGRHPDTHRATCGRPQVSAFSERSWAPGPASRPGSTGPGKCRTNSGHAGVGGRSRTPSEAGSCDFRAVPGGAADSIPGAESTARGRSSVSALFPPIFS